MLHINDFWLKYRGASEWSLRSIDFEVHLRELVVIAGPSGSGKSTLAQAIIGLIPGFIPATTKGSILIDNKELNKIERSLLLQKIGYIPQYPADFTTTMVVEEEIAFPLENQGLSKENIKTRIKEVLEALNITHLSTKLMTELSSGELQRVSLATALALSPPILILDEPMARIDPKSEIILVRILKKLAKEGHLILAFEHRLDYLLTAADQILFIDRGKILAKGPPREILGKMKGVDVPEVSEIIIDEKYQRPIDISEALSLLQSIDLSF
ncbi:MAG: energy-coupling factor ABC transporter ATP-binding protein [Candidatus Hodarchaeota archaeon]